MTSRGDFSLSRLTSTMIAPTISLAASAARCRQQREAHLSSVLAQICGRTLTIVSVSPTRKRMEQCTAPDSVTNAVNAKITATGTVTRRDSAVSVVNNSSDQTITGLAVGSTQRTVNGTSRGQESTTGKNADGAFAPLVQARRGHNERTHHPDCIGQTYLSDCRDRDCP